MNVRQANYAITLLALLNAPAWALEFSPGDYEMLPNGKNFFLTYFQYSHSDAFYTQGNQAAGDNKLRSEATLLRFIHAVRPVDNISIEPQIIVPLADVKAYGAASYLGEASGPGDMIIGVPVKINPDREGKNIFSLAPFITLPTGDWDNDRPLNVGENRWRFLLQGVWIHHFSSEWAFDTGADVSWVTKNEQYGANEMTLRQQARYEYQAWLRYNFSPATQLGVGGGWITGAESRIDGSAQDDRLNSTYARISFAHFVTPSVQLQASAGRDLHVEQGFRQDFNLSLRLGILF